MIVKVQKPMADPKAMWLVRSQDGKFRKVMLPGSMPPVVVKAVGHAPKAYFEATINGKEITFGAEATRQTW
jgi:hypothetical protein